MSTRTERPWFRPCLDCPRVIRADSDDLRCPTCAAKRDAANAATDALLLRTARAHRVASLGARPAAFVERVMRFWDAALRAQLAGGVHVLRAADCADQLTQPFARRLLGLAAPVVALPFPDGWRDRGGQAGGPDWMFGELLNAYRAHGPRSVFGVERAEAA